MAVEIGKLYLPVVGLFPLFQRGNRLREQAVGGLNFSFRNHPVSFGYKRNGVVIFYKKLLFVKNGQLFYNLNKMLRIFPL